MLFAEEIRIFKNTDVVSECGPSLAQSKRQRDEREVEAANQLGADILNHGVETGLNRTPLPMTTDYGCQPPTKKSKSAESLFSKYYNLAMNGKMKIRQVKTISNVKREFTVANSERGKKNFVVQLTNTPCCTCIDFDRNKAKVVCSHIIFVVMVALECPEIEAALKSRYLGDDDLQGLKIKIISPTFFQKTGKKRLGGPLWTFYKVINDLMINKR